MEQQLIELERRGWEALATEGAAAGFYGDVLDAQPVFVVPGMVITEREAIVESMSGPPWSSYELGELHVHALTDDVATVTYRARATRGDAEPYEAQLTSVYVKRADGWRLALHQQTPTPR